MPISSSESLAPTAMNILVIGSGGREHAIVSKLVSEWVNSVWVLPGNPGMLAEWNKVQKFPEIAVTESTEILANIGALIEFIREKAINLVVIWPEVPLCSGLADALRKAGISVFGPNQEAAKFEWSKILTENFNTRHGITQPLSRSYDADSRQDALGDLEIGVYPIVIKYPYLAAGKWVTIAYSIEEAREAIRKCYDGNTFGKWAESSVVLQEFIQWTEMSAFFLVDTKSNKIRYFSSGQDHKTRYEPNHEWQNPMTGGMGTVSPSPFEANQSVMDQVTAIGNKFLAGLKEDWIEYQGVLFAGLMVDKDNGVKVLEYNVRFGDPETQSILARMKSRISDVMMSVARGDGSLANMPLEFSGKALTLVAVDPGYPWTGTHKWALITGTHGLPEWVKVIHAGTKLDYNGNTVVSGGRVFWLVVSWDDGTTFEGLNTIALAAMEQTKLWGVPPGYRTDIGKGKDPA